MAEETPSAPPSQAGKGIGSKLSKKLGPLPVWGWGLVGLVGAYFVYKYISGKSAASAAATTAATAPTTGTTGVGSADTTGASGGGSSGYSDGGGGQLAGLLSQLQSQGIGATSAGPGTAPAVGAFSGYGYGAQGGPGSYESAQGQSYQELTAAQIRAMLQAGQTVYEQVQPGVFTPFPGTGISSGYNPTTGTPLFGSSPYTGPAVSNVSGAGGSVSPPAQAGTSPTAGTAGAPAPVRSGGIGPLPAVKA
jgi:hypothetical protein